MEDLCQRIPSVAVMIFKNLNNQSLIKSKEASSEISQLMHNERFYWIRIIMNYNRYFLEYQALWNKILVHSFMHGLDGLQLLSHFKVSLNSFRYCHWFPFYIAWSIFHYLASRWKLCGDCVDPQLSWILEQLTEEDSWDEVWRCVPISASPMIQSLWSENPNTSQIVLASVSDQSSAQ